MVGRVRIGCEYDSPRGPSPAASAERRTLRSMKVRGVLRSTETREIEAEAASYAEAQAALAQAVPEGWALIAIKVDRD